MGLLVTDRGTRTDKLILGFGCEVLLLDSKHCQCDWKSPGDTSWSFQQRTAAWRWGQRSNSWRSAQLPLLLFHHLPPEVAMIVCNIWSGRIAFSEDNSMGRIVYHLWHKFGHFAVPAQWPSWMMTHGHPDHDDDPNDGHLGGCSHLCHHLLNGTCGGHLAGKVCQYLVLSSSASPNRHVICENKL